MFEQIISTLAVVSPVSIGIVIAVAGIIAILGLGFAEATYQSSHEVHDVDAGEALDAGEVQQLSDGRAAVYAGANAAASGDEVALRVAGRFNIAKASATTFSLGDDVYFDASASQAVAPALTHDGDADFYLGKCSKAAINGDTTVEVELNAPSRYDILKPFVVEFDHADTDSKVLIPAEQNPHGLVIEQVYAIVTEQPAGSTEDQMIVTVSDESDNALSTLTTTDTSPDAVGDCVMGTNGLYAASTGDALPKTVAAGEFVDAAVTQATAGTPAGKVKVYIVARPLV